MTTIQYTDRQARLDALELAASLVDAKRQIKRLAFEAKGTP